MGSRNDAQEMEDLCFEEIYQLALNNPIGLSFALNVIHNIPTEVAVIITDVVKLSGGSSEWFYSVLDTCAISIGIATF